MELSEKLRAMLSLTSVRNNELAKAVNIDSAQISRLCTGARKSPRNPELLRVISEYLASRFNGDYMPSALYDLTHDARLHTACDENMLASVIYDWFLSHESRPFCQAGIFLSCINEFSAVNEQKSKKADSADDAADFEGRSSALREYSGNDGRRLAVKEIFNLILSMEKPCTIKIFSDESDNWLVENRVYMSELTQLIGCMANKGCKTVRVLPTEQNIESIFRDIERWMPAYMSGAIRLYNYPRARDALHRMSMIIVPEKYVLFSMSLFGQREANTTFLSTDPTFIDEYEKHFDCILELTKSMISVYTPDEKDKLLRKLRNIAQINDSGIYKCRRLSPHTLPSTAIGSMSKRGSQYANRVLECYKQNEQSRFNVLKENIIIDIMSFPDIDSVMRGEEPVPGISAGKEILYYTPEEYGLHLERIIWYLKTFINYRAVFIDDMELSNVVIYTKGNDHALLIKENEPFTLF